MSETQRPLTSGEYELAYLLACARWLEASDNELLVAVAGVLKTFHADYETEEDTPECPNCDGGYCRGHDLETYHVRCGAPVPFCDCFKPYLELARRAIGDVPILA